MPLWYTTKVLWCTTKVFPLWETQRAANLSEKSRTGLRNDNAGRRMVVSGGDTGVHRHGRSAHGRPGSCSRGWTVPGHASGALGMFQFCQHYQATWSRVVLQLIPVNAQTTLGIARTSIFKKEEIAKMNAWLEGLPPAEQPIELLKWAHKTIAADTWVQFTSFGANDSRVQVQMHPRCWGVQRWRLQRLTLPCAHPIRTR